MGYPSGRYCLSSLSAWGHWHFIFGMLTPSVRHIGGPRQRRRLSIVRSHRSRISSKGSSATESFVTITWDLRSPTESPGASMFHDDFTFSAILPQISWPMISQLGVASLPATVRVLPTWPWLSPGRFIFAFWFSPLFSWDLVEQAS